MTADADRAGQRWALVTGASSGIGRAYAEKLAARRYNLVIVARDAGRLAEVAERVRGTHNVECEVLPADLVDPVQRRGVEQRLAAAPAVDLLVNNAGFGTTGQFVDLDLDTEERQILLNQVALMRLTRAALPGMVERRRGAIVNVSSLAGFVPGASMATYCATKAFVTSFTEALHEELRGTGVRVQALCPGLTRTEFQHRAGVDASRAPGFLWMTAEDVVDESLRGLRRRKLVVVPGKLNRSAAALIRVSPHPAVRRVTAQLNRHR